MSWEKEKVGYSGTSGGQGCREFPALTLLLLFTTLTMFLPKDEVCISL